MEKDVGSGEGFIGVVKKKKRKTYDRRNSLKNKENNNKAKGNDMPDCIRIILLFYVNHEVANSYLECWRVRNVR